MLNQKHRGTCRAGGGKFKDFPIKFKAFVSTNRKSPKIFRRIVNIFENLTISKELGSQGPLSPATMPLCCVCRAEK